MPKRTDIKKVLVIGSGPIVIGQAAEFDYAGTQACLALKEEGYEVILCCAFDMPCGARRDLYRLRHRQVTYRASAYRICRGKYIAKMPPGKSCPQGKS